MASEGAFQWETVYDLPVYLRRFYARKLDEILKKRHEEVARAKKGKGSSPKSIQKPSIQPR